MKIEDFYSSLKGEGIKQEDYNKFMDICEKENIIYVKDLLKWYNNLDVRPMLKACLKQKELYYTFKLDMYKDAFSLPGLAEHILYQFQIKGFEEYLLERKVQNTKPFQLSILQIVKKINGYKKQDIDKKRDASRNITAEEVRYILQREDYCCYYCWTPMTSKTWSLDRINCEKGHEKDNCVAACIKCNKARSNKLFKKFYRHKALLRWEIENPMIWLFSEKK